MYDVVIIGAGVSGSAIARELSRYQVNACVVEKAEDVCNKFKMAFKEAWIHDGDRVAVMHQKQTALLFMPDSMLKTDLLWQI